LINIVYGTTAELIKLENLIKRLKIKTEVFTYCSNQQQDDLEKFHINYNFMPDHKYTNSNGKGLTSIGLTPIWFFKNVMILSRLVKKNKSKNESFILVQGDTLTALVGAVVAVINRIKLIHVEAGLRSKNLFSPFPEEIIRILISFACYLHFAPGENAVRNLSRHRGIKINTHFNTGIEQALKTKFIRNENKERIQCVVVLHRSELLSRKRKLLTTLSELMKIAKEKRTVLIMDQHLEHQLIKFGVMKDLVISKIHVIKKLEHANMLKLLNNCDFVITDSGGLQEELYVLGQPVLVHRKFTERNDGLNQNARLSKLNVAEITAFSNNFKEFERPPMHIEKLPSEIISDYVINNLSIK